MLGEDNHCMWQDAAIEGIASINRAQLDAKAPPTPDTVDIMLTDVGPAPAALRLVELMPRLERVE